MRLSRWQGRMVMMGLIGGVLFSCSSGARVVWEKRVGDGGIANILKVGENFYFGTCHLGIISQSGKILFEKNPFPYLRVLLGLVEGEKLMFVGDVYQENTRQTIIEIGYVKKDPMTFVPLKKLGEKEKCSLFYAAILFTSNEILIGGGYSPVKVEDDSHPSYLLPFLAKVDTNGDPVWLMFFEENREKVKQYPYDGWDAFYRVVDGEKGYITHTPQEILIIDRNQGKVMERFSIEGLNYIGGIWGTKDMGLLVSGADEKGNRHLVKCDSFFRKEWDYTNKDLWGITSVLSLSDGGFLVMGQMLLTKKVKGREIGYGSRVLLIRLDEGGREIWRRKVRGNQFYNTLAKGIEVAPNEYILVGEYGRRYVKRQGYPGQWVSRGWIVKIREEGVKR
ncbi:MAG: hypothetical protein HPY78_10605 [Brevinematales bacterium]|nr:hypothetical protein [Brevinematales bacterium]